MNSECKNAFEKTKKLIQERKKRLGNKIEPEVQNLESGILLQYFEKWINYEEIDSDDKFIGNLKKRLIKKIDNIEDIKEVYMSFGTRGDLINYDVTDNKLFIMLDGCAEFEDVETKEKWILEPFSAKVFHKKQKLNIYGKNDINYFITIKFNSPLT